MGNGTAESAEIFPNELLEEGFHLNSGDRRWRVLYTKSRHEKAVAKHLVALEIPFFLPLVTKVTISRGRKTKSRIPLFSNYVFMFGDKEERLQAWSTNRLSRVLDVEDATQLRNDLWQLSQAISSGAPLTKEERLVPGQHVRVRSGQLKGMEGTVIERQGKRRLLIAVNFLQQGASIALDDYQVEALQATFSPRSPNGTWMCASLKSEDDSRRKNDSRLSEEERTSQRWNADCWASIAQQI